MVYTLFTDYGLQDVELEESSQLCFFHTVLTTIYHSSLILLKYYYNPVCIMFSNKIAVAFVFPFATVFCPFVKIEEKQQE